MDLQNKLVNPDIFSADGTNCYTKPHACNNCSLYGILAVLGEDVTDWRNNRSSQGWSCNAFARYIFVKTFGSVRDTNDRENIGQGNQASTYSSLRTGDFIFSPTHFMIFLYSDSSGIYVLDANGASDLRIRTDRFLPYSHTNLKGSISTWQSPRWNEVNNTPLSTVTITAPQNMTASRSGDRTVRISWEGVTGANRYEVEYRSPNTNNQWIREADYKNNTATSYTAERMGNHVYYFRVRAVNSAGTRSEWSQVLEYEHRRDGNLPQTSASSTWMWPIPEGTQQNAFSNSHQGIDINPPVRGDLNTNVLATRAGEIVSIDTTCRNHNGLSTLEPGLRTNCRLHSGCSPSSGDWCNGGLGNFVRIKHSDGIESRYAHLGAVHVRVGDMVSQGQSIGLMASTGQSNYVHLHFDIFVNGIRVNPRNYVNPSNTVQSTTATIPNITSVTTNGNSVTINWNAAVNATHYNVYILQEPWRWADIKQSAQVNGTSHTFHNVAVGSYAAFVISRPNADNVQSEWKSFNISPAQPTTPQTLTTISATTNRPSGTTADRYSYTVTTNAPAARIEFRFNNNSAVYTIHANGTNNFNAGTGSVSADRMTWTWNNDMLGAGNRMITITAFDTSGKSVTTTLNITVSTPTTATEIITVSATANRTSGTVNDRYSYTITTNIPASKITLSFSGNSALYTINANGTSNINAGSVNVSTDRRTWSWNNDILGAGNRVITVTAYDEAGNSAITTLTINVTR
jgi:murein DD-endopeptidase MepM/ murein hydrolase activator NlpD